MRYLALLLFAAFPGAAAEIEVQNDQKYTGSDGIAHIVGEIQNGLEAPISRAEVSADLYRDGQLVGQAGARALVNTIMPGMTSPFDIMIPGDIEADEYYLRVDYAIAAPKNQRIDVESEMRRDGQDNIMIMGTVTNMGSTTANIVSVVATMYDRDGNVAATHQMHTEPDYLRSNEQAFFVVPVTDRDRTDSIVDYTVSAESEEYAAVPEFPLGGIVFAASFAGYILILSRPGLTAGLIRAGDPKQA